MPLRLTTYYPGNDIPPLPGTDTFHSTELFHIYQSTPGYSPLLIVASEEGQVVAKLLAVVRKSVRMFPPSIIRRCEIFGTGEYFTPEDRREAIFTDMLQRLTDEALRAVAKKTIERKSGARGLRSVMESILIPIMYQVPSDPTIVKVTITPETVAGGEPVLEYGAVRKRYKNTGPVV